MTRENLIFLGTCTIMSSNPKNFYNCALPDVEGDMYTQAERVSQAIGWARHLYDRVHTPEAFEPVGALGQEADTVVFDDEFPTELEAERALDTFFRYRVGKL